MHKSLKKRFLALAIAAGAALPIGLPTVSTVAAVAAVAVPTEAKAGPVMSEATSPPVGSLPTWVSSVLPGWLMPYAMMAYGYV